MSRQWPVTAQLANGKIVTRLAVRKDLETTTFADGSVWKNPSFPGPSLLYVEEITPPDEPATLPESVKCQVTPGRYVELVPTGLGYGPGFEYLTTEEGAFKIDMTSPGRLHDRVDNSELES